MMDAKTIEALARWTEPKEIQTKHGPRLLRKAEVTPEFSTAWKSHKEEIKTFGATFSKDERTSEWMLAWWQPLTDETKAQRAASVEASRAASAEIDLPHPPDYDYMPFQKAGIKYALSRHGTLIGDEMGLGKTIMAIGVINADPTIDSALIICPKSLKLNWQRELARWLVRPLSVGVANGDFPDAQIVIASYENIKKHAEKISTRGEWGLCVVDEAHMIKNRKAQRSQAVKAIRARRHLRMTGTPIVNRPAELQNIVDDLDPAFAGFGYLKRYCNATRTRFGWDFSGASNLDELQRRLRETIMVRRLKADVLTELPRKIRQVVEVEPTTPEMRACVSAEAAQEAESDERLTHLRADVELAKAEGENAYAQAVARLRKAAQVDFAEMSKRRHDTAVAKVPAVMEHLTTCMEDDDEKKIIIGAHHHDVIDRLAEACRVAGWQPVSLTGENNESERLAAVDALQNNPQVRIFIGSIQAAGVGITLTAAAHVVFAELDWVPGNVSQFEARADRIGQTESVLIQHVVLSGSIDARMAEMIVSKQRVIDSALDKDHPERAVLALPEPKAKAATQAETVDTLKAAGDAMTAEQVKAVHSALRLLAGLDVDGASELNDMGFNKLDTAIGHSLARADHLSPRQAALGAKLIKKYWRQLPEEMLEAAGIK